MKFSLRSGKFKKRLLLFGKVVLNFFGGTEAKVLPFLILLTIYFLLSGAFAQLFEMPQGIHFIRQTDSLSFLSNYFRFDAGFFEPQVYNLSSAGGKAVNEFPIIYFFTALLYRLFGEHDFLLRSLNFLISLAGFIALYKIIYLIIKDSIYTYFFAFLMLSSTVVLYYFNNFLPDPAALGFTLVGWYFFLKVFYSSADKYFIAISFFFFTLASLIKVTYFIHPVAIVVSLLIAHFSLKKEKTKAGFMNYTLIAFIFSLILVLSWWFVFVLDYNQSAGDKYFLTTIRPVWSLSKLEIAEVWHSVSISWHNHYLYQNSYYLIALLLLFGLPFALFKKSFMNFVTIALLAGSAVLFTVFYAQYRDHDYYFLNYFIPLVFLLLHAFNAVKVKFPSVINAVYLKLILVLFCAFSLFDTAVMVNKRYENSRDIFSEVGFVLHDFDKILDSLEISGKAKFIIYPDYTKNGGLYTIKRKGWNISETDSGIYARIDHYSAAGAEYLITIKPLTELTFDTVYAKESLTIYQLQ